MTALRVVKMPFVIIVLLSRPLERGMGRNSLLLCVYVCNSSLSISPPPFPPAHSSCKNSRDKDRERNSLSHIPQSPQNSTRRKSTQQPGQQPRWHTRKILPQARQGDQSEIHSPEPSVHQRPDMSDGPRGRREIGGRMSGLERGKKPGGNCETAGTRVSGEVVEHFQIWLHFHFENPPL